MMFGAINAMTAEMMAIADKMDIAPKLLYETISASQAGTVSNLFKELGARIAGDNYEAPTFTVDLLIKDVRLGLEMAEGVRRLMGTDIGLSDTGIAGPGGATPDKPVGLFYIGLSSKGRSYAQEHIFPGDRLENKRGAAEAALRMLREYLIGLK